MTIIEQRDGVGEGVRKDNEVSRQEKAMHLQHPESHSWESWAGRFEAIHEMLQEMCYQTNCHVPVPMMHEWAEGHANPQSCSGARHLRLRSLEIRGDSRKGSQGTWGPTVDCRSPTGSGEFLAHWRAGLRGSLLLDPTRGGGRLLEMTGVVRGGNGSP